MKKTLQKTLSSLASLAFLFTTFAPGLTAVPQVLAATTINADKSGFTLDINQTDTATFNFTGYENVTVSFEYDSTALDGDASDNFTYELKIGATTIDSGTINGVTGVDDPSENNTINISDSGLDDMAVATLTITNNGDSAGSDDVVISNITATGDVISAGVLNAENFNTVDGNYKGISVGFNAEDFGTVTAVTVDMERADGSHVIKHGNQGVFDIISGATTPQQLTAPFVIQEGTFTEASDIFYWDPAPATWTVDTAPVSVTITVTDENGDTVITDTNFDEGDPSWPAYESLLPLEPKDELMVEVTGNTFNGSTGWWFNRDASTSTPFEFNSDQASVGDGSLYVLPIGSNPADKFIGEYFTDNMLVEDFNSLSYDFYIGDDDGVNDADHFYLNVYTNIEGSSSYYDCRFDYVPSNGSVGDFDTATFSASDVAQTVAGSECPGSKKLEDMPAGSTISVLAISVGDTSVNDQDLDGYYDNVVLETTSKITTFDFEPAAVDNTPPVLSDYQLSDYEFGPSDVNPTLTGSISDLDSLIDFVKIAIWERTSEGTKGLLKLNWTTIPAADSAYDESDEETNHQINTPSIKDYPEGKYILGVRGWDVEGNKGSGGDLVFTVVDESSDAPATPTNLHRVAADDGEVLACGDITTRETLYPTWDENTEDDFSHYEYTSINANGQIGINEQVMTENQFVHNWVPPVDGTNGFKVRAVDNDGNKSEWSEVCEITYDSVAPTAPEIIRPVNEQVFTSTPILNDWTDSTDDNGIDHYQIEYVYDDGHTFSNAPYRETPGNVSQRNHVPGLAEQGGVTIRVRAYDPAGNVSDWSNSVHYYYDVDGVVDDGGEGDGDDDSKEATLEITYPAADGDPVFKGDVTFTATYMDDDATLDDISWAIRKGTCEAEMGTIAGNVDGHTDTATFDGENFSFTLNMSGNDSGDYCFVINPVEQSGEADLRETRLFNLDDPVMTFSLFSGGGSTLSSSSTGDDGDVAGVMIENDGDGKVLGESEMIETYGCSVPFLTTFFHPAANNSPIEVFKLQVLLNLLEQAGLPLSRTYDAPTIQAVNNYQLKYASEILAPWGLTTPTGYVYLTTRKHMNERVCQDYKEELPPVLVPDTNVLN